MSKKNRRIWRSMESKSGTFRCPKCGSVVEVRKSVLTIVCPAEYKMLGFRAVVGIPCTGPDCRAMHWMVLESVVKGHWRIFREAWENSIETQDLVPFDSEMRK